MAMTTVATASWGIEDGKKISNTTGVLTDITEHKELVQSPEQNEVGATIQMAVYDIHWTLSATLQVKNGIHVPKIGDVVTITGGENATYILTSADKIENNMGFQKISISGECYTNLKAAAGVKTYGNVTL